MPTTVSDQAAAWSAAAHSTAANDLFSRMPFFGPAWAKVILTMFAYTQITMSLCCGPDSGSDNVPYFGHMLSNLVVTGNPPSSENTPSIAL